MERALASSKEKLIRPLPGQGKYHLSGERKFEPVIVFVHFFGGSQKYMYRHVRWVNELGFDAVTFNLSFNKKTWIAKCPMALNRKFGLKYIWADEIENVLNCIKGPLIIYAFSGPAACAVEVIARTGNKVRGLICDSGPFLETLKCNRNLLTYEYVIKNSFIRISASLGLVFLWGMRHRRDMYKDFKSFPKNFPILSIRGCKDMLVPVSAIEAAFKGHEHLNIEVFSLKEAGHLNGLKSFPLEYKARVKKFLLSYFSSDKEN